MSNRPLPLTLKRTSGTWSWTLNTHQSESLVRYVAEVEGLDLIWVLKANRGFKSMQTRSTLLSDPTHRKRVSLHAQALFLAQPGGDWFSILVRKLLPDVLVSQVLRI